MRTNELNQLLKERYSGQEYALFFNVADGTGTGVGRWADAVAINLWPSRGLEIEGNYPFGSSRLTTILTNPTKF